MTRPIRPTPSEATTSGMIQSPSPASDDPNAEVVSPPVKVVWSSSAKKPASMYREPCAMLTTRMSPKMSVKPLATTK